jgi:hypothetical protein
MFPVGNVRQPLIAGDLRQLVCGVSVEGHPLPPWPPFAMLHLGICFSRKQAARSETVDALLPRGRDAGNPLGPVGVNAHVHLPSYESRPAPDWLLRRLEVARKLNWKESAPTLGTLPDDDV